MAIAAIMAVAILGVFSGVARAATSDTLTLTPSSLQAGGDPNLTAVFDFSYPSASTTDTVQSVSLTLPAGLVLLPTAPTATCTSAELKAYDCPAASLIGTGAAAGASSLSLTANLYEMAAPSSTNIGGVGIIFSDEQLTGSTAVASASGPLGLSANSSGAPVETLSLTGFPQTVPGLDILGTALTTTPVQLNSLSLTVNGTTTAKTAFTRMPASCTAGTAAATIDTYTAADDGTASTTVTPTGCSSLAYTPTLTAAGAKDPSDSGVEIVAQLAQAAGQTPGKSLTLTFPSDVTASAAGFTATLCATPNATFSNCTEVGAASLTTPLAAKAIVADAYLTGSSTAPTLTLAFPAPYAFTLTGALGGTSAGVTATFTDLPDLPSTSLALLVVGGAHALFTSTCAATTGTISTALIAQNGVAASPTAPFTLSGCTSPTPTPAKPKPKPITPGKPTVSSISLTGVASAKARLGFTVAAGKNGAPRLSSVTVGLPSGVSFVKAKLKTGVTVSGATIKSASLNAGKLTVTLRSAASGFTVRVGSSALKVSKSLAGKVKKHKTKSVKLTITVTNASGATTSFTDTVKV
jgi:hypothetical protein